MSRATPAGCKPAARGHRGDPPHPLSLTFDDGPDPAWTPLILEQLERCGASATFFVIGERVLAHPDVVRDVLAAGDDIQLHCHRHIRHTELTEEELQHDTEMALEALESVGVRPRLWRAPWGVATSASRRVAERHGLQLVGWAVDTHDWRGDAAETMLDRARPQLHDGGAILMHDGLGPGAQRDGCENTLELVPALVAAARAEGLPLTPMRQAAIEVAA